MLIHLFPSPACAVVGCCCEGLNGREGGSSELSAVPLLLAWHGDFVLAHNNNSTGTHPLCPEQSSIPAVH